MKKLPLWVGSNWESRDPPLKDVQRNFHTAHAYLIILNDDNLINSLQSIDTIQHLTLEEVKVTKKHFCQLILALTNLDELVIDDSWIARDGSEWSSKRVSRNVLDKLIIKSHEWEFLTLIKKMDISVRELKLLAPAAVNVEILKHLRTFLTSQSVLKKLALNVSCPVLEVLATTENSFSLESLYVKHHESQEENSEEALLELLNRHRGSLENLELFMKLSNESLIRIAKILKIKRLMLWELPNDAKILPTISANRFLKKLVITGRIRNLDTLKWLLRSYSEIESLIIKEWAGGLLGDFLDFVCDHMKSLQHLELPFMRGEPANENALNDSRRISSLKSFRVENLPAYDAISALYTRIYAIETLAIKWLPKNAVYDDLVFIAARFPHLKHLKLGARFKANDRVLETFNRICPNLRRIEIYGGFGKTHENKTFEKIQVVNYAPSSSNHVFPFEKTMWQNEDDDAEAASSEYSSLSSSGSPFSDSDVDMVGVDLDEDADEDYGQDVYDDYGGGYLFQMFHQH